MYLPDILVVSHWEQHELCWTCWEQRERAAGLAGKCSGLCLALGRQRRQGLGAVLSPPSAPCHVPGHSSQTLPFSPAAWVKLFHPNPW